MGLIAVKLDKDCISLIVSLSNLIVSYTETEVFIDVSPSALDEEI